MAATDEWLTIPEIVEAARASMPPHLWDFSCGGAESETTLRRNRAAFQSIAFRTRVLRGVADRDVSTTFLGHHLSVPVMMAPVGSIANFHPDGALAPARAAERAGTISFVGTLATPALEDVRAGAKGPLVFQLYVRGGRDWMKRIVRRVERATYQAICLTVDSSAYGRRERDLHNRFFPRGRLGQPNLADLPAESVQDGHGAYNARLTWDDVGWLRECTRLPLMLKGIQSAEDAALAVEHGIDAVYVSNHGGRQIDHVPAAIEVLPEIVQAVDGRAEVIVDSGFLRGSDVAKALALGAKAVVIGKLMCWSLAAGGEPGLERALQLLKDELSVTMANVGVRTVSQLSPDCLRPSSPPVPPFWPADL